VHAEVPLSRLDRTELRTVKGLGTGETCSLLGLILLDNYQHFVSLQEGNGGDESPTIGHVVVEAFQAGRVSDEIFPKWEVPTYYEAQQKADEVIRRKFERGRREYGDD